MLVEPFIPFLLFVLALYATPGPATLSIAASGATFGFRKTIAYTLGTVSGLVIIFIMIALGLGLLFIQYPTVHMVFKWISLMYVFYLAYKIAMAGSMNTSNTKHLGFFQGISLTLLNPKAYFAVIATVTQFTKQGDGYTESFILLMIWIVFLAVVIDLTWAYIGGVIGNRATSTSISSKMNVLFALLLIGSVLLTMFL